jgi:hydroxylamine reductase (hybrid-cluster protein)
MPRLAVVEFSTNINNEKTKADAITVRNLVESQMVATRKYQIITRDDIDKLLENQRIQVSSISSSEKRNTQLIVDRLRSLRENEKAAQICTGMEINGCKDWFLPSKDELGLMCKT